MKEFGRKLKKVSYIFVNKNFDKLIVGNIKMS